MHARTATATGPGTAPAQGTSSTRVTELLGRGGQFRWVLPLSGVVFAALIVWRVYQQLFAWKYGLDSTAPVYDTYWHSLLAVNLVLISLVGAGALALLARGCKECVRQREEHGDVLPEHEIEHVWRLWAIVAGFAISFVGFAYFAEEDASWHATTIRDTAFTPSHIVLFWGVAPLAVILAACIYLYATTRLPKIYGKGVPLSLSLFFTGVFMLFVWVAFNEWGHSYWVAEELFSAPLHWGFVLFTFLAFGLVGVFVQGMRRMIEIAAPPDDPAGRRAAERAASGAAS